MNKPLYIFLFIILFCCDAKTQTEYITNGSFEDIDTCYGYPAGIGFDVFEWSGCKGWSNPIGSSSDLWCKDPKYGMSSPPNVGVGFQYPKTGYNMAAFLVNSGITQNYREYIQNELQQPLQLGKSYQLSFYIALQAVDCSPTSFGIKFYNSKYRDTTRLWLTDIMPDATNDTTLIKFDTLNWQLVTIPFKANGSEKFVIIGNFEDSLRLSYTFPCDTSFWGIYHMAGGYFFIDDVSLTELPFQEPQFPNIFTPNNDGVNDLWKVDLSEFNEVHCVIYNRWGIKEYETTKQLINWDGRTTSGSNCGDGVYFYVIQTEEKNYKGHIQLIR